MSEIPRLRDIDVEAENPYLSARYIPAVVSEVSMLKLLTFIFMSMDFSGSAGGTLESGRSVMGHSDACLSYECLKDTATIETGGYKVVVSAEVISVDGKVRIPINQGVKSVEVQLKRGKITLIADGDAVAEYRR